MLDPEPTVLNEKEEVELILAIEKAEEDAESISTKVQELKQKYKDNINLLKLKHPQIGEESKAPTSEPPIELTKLQV